MPTRKPKSKPEPDTKPALPPPADDGISQSEVKRILGVDSGNFQAYLNRGLLPCTVETVGKRTYRRFSKDKVIFFTIVGALLRLSIPISLAVNAANIFEKELEDRAAKQGSIGELPDYLIFTNEEMAWAYGAEAIEKGLKAFHNPGCVLLHCEMLAETVAANLVAIRRQNQINREARRDDAQNPTI